MYKSLEAVTGFKQLRRETKPTDVIKTDCTVLYTITNNMTDYAIHGPTTVWSPGFMS